jgi:hypothetical protein
VLLNNKVYPRPNPKVTPPTVTWDQRAKGFGFSIPGKPEAILILHSSGKAQFFSGRRIKYKYSIAIKAIANKKYRQTFCVEFLPFIQRSTLGSILMKTSNRIIPTIHPS